MIPPSLLPVSPCHTEFYSHSPLCPCRFFKSSLWSPSVLCQLASLGPSPSPVLALRSTICPSCGSSLGQSSDDFTKPIPLASQKRGSNLLLSGRQRAPISANTRSPFPTSDLAPCLLPSAPFTTFYIVTHYVIFL